MGYIFELWDVIMDIEIIYEHAERELYNANLLKFELEKRGYKVKISPAFEHKLPSIKAPKLVITPWLYDNGSIEPIKLKYLTRVNKILNLQYEQVISRLWLNTGKHCPSDLAKNGIHICWGNKIKRRLVKAGVPSENLKVINDMKFDYSNSKFKDFFKSKKELSEEFGINIDNQWNLFISSFSFANPNNDFIKRTAEDMGNYDSAIKFKEISNKSQEIILNWIEKFIIDHPHIEFIYRPHPSEIKENNISKFLNLSEKYDNFHFIFKYSVQDWIMNSDIINSWISTSIVDVYLLNKKCNVLRPIKVDEQYDIPFYINSVKLTTYDDFEKNNVNNYDNIFPINEDEIKEYYNIGEELNYKLICDFVEEIIDDEDYCREYYVKSPLLDVFSFLVNKIKKGRFTTIFKNLLKKKSSNKISLEDEESKKKIKKLENIVNNIN